MERVFFLIARFQNIILKCVEMEIDLIGKVMIFLLHYTKVSIALDLREIQRYNSK